MTNYHRPGWKFRKKKRKPRQGKRSPDRFAIPKELRCQVEKLANYRCCKCRRPKRWFRPMRIMVANFQYKDFRLENLELWCHRCFQTWLRQSVRQRDQHRCHCPECDCGQVETPTNLMTIHHINHDHSDHRFSWNRDDMPNNNVILWSERCHRRWHHRHG